MSTDKVAETTPRQYVNYAFFQVDPAWRRLPEAERTAGKEEFARVVDEFRGRAVVVPFSTVGTRPDCDFLIWRIAYDLEVLQEMNSRILATGLGKWLTRPYSFLGQAKTSVYEDEFIHPSQEEKRSRVRPGEFKYLFVYPFVKTREWFVLPKEERQQIMRSHIKVGHEYPSIKLNTIYSFGLDDQEWVVAFESNRPADFVDLVMELRETQSSLYTKRDTPIFTCIPRRKYAVRSRYVGRLGRRTMFGDEFIEEPGRVVRICCGPRCGAEIEHRRIYAALEAVVKSRDDGRANGALTIRPVMCQGYCGLGVTVVTPESAWIKIRAASEARDIKLTSEEIETCPQ